MPFKEDQAMTVPAFLPIMFADRQLWLPRAKHLYRGDHDGKKIGTVVATMSPKFDRYALNKLEFDRLLRNLRSGNIDMAFVVAAKLNGFGPEAYQYQGAGNAEIVAKRLEGVIPLQGRYGEFWALYLWEIEDDDDDKL
jgi:hypothetical protein